MTFNVFRGGGRKRTSSASPILRSTRKRTPDPRSPARPIPSLIGRSTFPAAPPSPRNRELIGSCRNGRWDPKQLAKSLVEGFGREPGGGISDERSPFRYRARCRLHRRCAVGGSPRRPARRGPEYRRWRV